MKFDDYHKLIARLIGIIKESGFKPDSVVGVIRGGYVPAEAISRAFGVPLVVIRTSSYHHGIKTNEPTILGQIGEPVGNVLIVDDLVDTGETLLKVKDYFKDFNPKTAVIWIKRKGVADFWAEEFQPGMWIHQPMETYDK